MGPLSVDLRKRVVSAVGEEGMSCRAAARRFGVSFAKAQSGGWRHCASAAAMQRCRWAATRVRSAWRRMGTTFCAFTGASLT